MKINRKKSQTLSKTHWILFIATLLLIAGLALGYAFFRPFDKSTVGTEVNHGGAQSDTSLDTENENLPAEETDKPAEAPDNDSQESTKPNYETIAPPSIATPSDNAPYPIENARYRIDRVSSKSFRITLYPVEGPDYDKQLREYKSDALSYLESRYGSTSNLTIEWKPPAAASL